MARSAPLLWQQRHAAFLATTSSRYNNMRARLEKKKLPPPPFTLDELRRDILSVMGGKEDGAIECRYCKGIFTIEEVAIDHATPLSQNGSLGLDNLDYPCGPCNDRKGGLTLAQYSALLAFLETQHPIARRDVLSRLQKANALAQGARRAIIQIKKLQETKRPPEPELAPF